MIGLKRTTQPPASTDLEGGSEEEIEALRAQFERQHYVRLRGFLGPALLEEVVARMDESRLRPHQDEGIGEEARDKAGAAFNLLMFAVNDPRLFELVSRITGRTPINFFQGRVYRLDPAEGHHDSWHDDLAPSRLAAMSVNLSARPYDGGALQIRDRHTAEVLHEVDNRGAGDAVIFHIAENLQHRVTPIVGSAPRTAFAGWFQSSPSWVSLLEGGEPARPSGV